MAEFNAKQQLPGLLDWMRAQMKACGGKTAVIGISGGKDSSVVAALSVAAYGRENVVGVLMPDGVQPDIDYSNGLVDVLNIRHYTFNIHGGTSGILDEMARVGIDASRQTKVNLPSRIRMATLYAIAQSVDAGIVVNTSNLSEDWVGYSTRYGDAAGDFSPLSHLTVQEVRAVGRALGLPDRFVDKTPIDGLCGKTDEENLGFTYAYTIDDADGDTLTVVEELNDETIRTINYAPKGEELTVTITSEKLYALGLNSVNTLKITVTDGKGGTAYRRVTFKRTNSAPTISGQDKALGLKNGSFAENYTVSDVEGDNVVVTEFIDDKKIRSYQATLGQEETIELSRENWLTLTNGAHQLRVEAVDGNFATSVRVWNFSKKETVIAFRFAKPEETDARATKILITPTWHIEGSVAKVEACNNAFDDSPAWEDITAQVAINRVYNFLNESKTAEKWGVNVRFTITKNEGYEEEVSISGFGGAYE